MGRTTTHQQLSTGATSGPFASRTLCFLHPMRCAQRLVATTILLAVVYLFGAGCAAPSATTPDAPTPTSRTSVELLPSIVELPDPFVFADGSRVTTSIQWPRRRQETLQQILTYEYGQLPPVPAKGSMQVAADPTYELPPDPDQPKTMPATAPTTAPSAELPAGTRQEKLLLTVPGDTPGQSVRFHLVLTLPPTKGPFPVVVWGDVCWGPIDPAVAAELVNRGYILAAFDRTEIVPDDNWKATRKGAHVAFPGRDFGAIAGWAWGYHRVIDYLATRPEVDMNKVVATGHSRGGKAALLAGATDTRIALTVPSCSGCGGAGCFRYQAEKSEDLPAILKKFPYWFQPQLKDFIGHLDRLPIDQHSVKAAVAPRALLTTEALGDVWANLPGTQRTHLAAKKVYDFLGAGDKIAIYFRPGEHDQNFDDWQALLDFADHLFYGKPTARPFNELPFPVVP